jgi:hypothetical protein
VDRGLCNGVALFLPECLLGWIIGYIFKPAIEEVDWILKSQFFISVIREI